MKKLILSLVAVLVSLYSFAGVELRPYTDTLRKTNNLSRADIANLYLYNSNDIILHKVLVGDTASTTTHKLVTTHVNNDSTIIIKAGTPGIIIAWLEDSTIIRVRFSDDTSHALNFKENLVRESGRYMISAQNWGGQIGKIHYAGGVYYSDPISSLVNLKVDVSNMKKHSSKRITEKGAKF